MERLRDHISTHHFFLHLINYNIASVFNKNIFQKQEKITSFQRGINLIYLKRKNLYNTYTF